MSKTLLPLASDLTTEREKSQPEVSSEPTGKELDEIRSVIQCAHGKGKNCAFVPYLTGNMWNCLVEHGFRPKYIAQCGRRESHYGIYWE